MSLYRYDKMAEWFFFAVAILVGGLPLSLHDRSADLARTTAAMSGGWPSIGQDDALARGEGLDAHEPLAAGQGVVDRKSTRLNSSHLGSSYAVFCLKKKKKVLS